MREFNLFNLTPTFNLDLQALEARYRQLQLKWHPDRGGDEALSSDLAQAYHKLRDSLERALLVLDHLRYPLPIPTDDQWERWLDWDESSSADLLKKREELIGDMKKSFAASDLETFGLLCLELRAVYKALKMLGERV